MPNKRADNKKQIGAYIPEALKKPLQDEAKKRKLNLSELMEQILQKSIDEYKNK